MRVLIISHNKESGYFQVYQVTARLPDLLSHYKDQVQKARVIGPGHLSLAG